MAPKKDAEGAAGHGQGAKKSDAATKRSRWATRKLTVKSSSLKRLSLMAKRHNRTTSGAEKRASGGSESLRQGDFEPNQQQQQEEADSASQTGGEHNAGPRQLYFNLPLPDELKDDSGDPIQTYKRNKIRTAKYTPLSFIPKNLWFQFHNIANIFFLFVIILNVFPIFGGVNPGLNAVPLIAIIFLTAVKDAIEDYRRTILDNELNNAPVHRLVGWGNVNVKEDNVSAWRRFKKANSRFFGSIWHGIQRLWKKKEKKAENGYSDDEGRVSVETRRESVVSPHAHRQSLASGRGDVEMTPVSSPLPRPENTLTLPKEDRPNTSYSFEGEEAAYQQFNGDLINHNKPAPGKARFHRDAWKNLVVGDFVRIYNDEELPADVIVLATSDSTDGACYVETKNLDGETNLKVRFALRCGRAMKHARDCERAEFLIESEAPQPNLYKYNGAIKWMQAPQHNPNGQPREMTEPITIDNMLLRGCHLRNTDWVLGVVLFTGHDTKTMLNAGETPSKRARIARELNWNVIVNFGLLLILCLIAALVNGFAWGNTDASLTFFDWGPIGGTPALSGFITFWASMILFQNMVPISLYITLEIVRTLQAIFIYSDVGMYYDKLDQPCIPKSWNISDDVGQIEYIFSDKTGTLTQNVMEFKKATINGQPYGEAYTEAQAGMQKRMGVDVAAESDRIRAEIADARVRALKGLRELNDNPYLHDEELTFVAPDFVDDLAGKHGEPQRYANERFMLALALCHTVIAERQPGEPPRIVFKAQSPDEAALVATARDMGFTVLGSNTEGITLNVMGEERHYPILNTIEFNSTRKRMSAIVRMPDNKIILFCKGADSVIYSRLKRGEQKELRQSTAEHLEMFAREGLRTLCIAEKEISESDYKRWRAEHDKAAAAIEDRDDKLEEVADAIEQDLFLLGGTAIEDRLQDGVPDTIALLGEAGIKLWVLTGDKVETAINIGFSCNLLNNDMELLRLQVEEDEGGQTSDEEYMHLVEQDLDKYLQAFQMTGSDEELKAARKDHGAPEPTHALIIDGFTLRWVLTDELQQKFLLLCKQCKSVLCCRVSPAQKAAVVAMVKNGLDVMTLSVGDGANDVAMIQEADVGVGIAGVEGRQAVMSSDYAIGQFHYLRRLILVHGRWSYRRVGETMANFFYKNVVWVFGIFWFQIYCNFDSSYVFDYTYILCFNLFFTSVPVILMGVLDQDVGDTIALAVPELYRRGIMRLEWTATKFWLYMIDAVYQSIMVFYIPYFTMIYAGVITANGLDDTDRLKLGAYIAHGGVIAINLYILINTYRWDWLMLLVVFLSDVFVFLWTGAYGGSTYGVYFYKLAPAIYGELTFWMVTIIVPIVCMVPRFMIKALQKVFFPYDVDIIREQVSMGKFKELKNPLLPEAEEAGDNLKTSSSASSNNSSSGHRKGKHILGGSGSKQNHHVQNMSVDEDRRPIYPPSVATHNTRTQNGSDGTNYTMHDGPSSAYEPQPHDHTRTSAEIMPDLANVDTALTAPSRPSIDRARPSYDRMRASMDRVRQSYEASNDFTSAARLSRIESSHSSQGGHGPAGTRRFNLNTVRRRGLSAFSKKSVNDQ